MARKTTIIAEIGENHHGAWDIAAKMLEEAAARGADIVKFQSYRMENFSPDDPDYDWFKRVALPDEKHLEFKQRAEALGVEFMSSPFTPERAEFLCEKVGCQSIKVASGVMMSFEMLDVINAHGGIPVRRVYLSTGMATIDEIHRALEHLDKINEVTILHCVTQYPARPDQANLRCIPTLIKEFSGHAVGYSDHVPGLVACVTAVALGATVLEKHFTFSRHLPGTDHQCAMLPEELTGLCRQVEQIEQLLGTGKKKPNPEELEIRDFVRSRFRGGK
ncbi:MAG: N-acetylneuraminate synthase family protein [Phycisphaerae bacterium]|jgi:sialic acid synthase SpsE|nr:N-acetylneuraminate synthase family protein [Phycisphaerae bacterium]